MIVTKIVGSWTMQDLLKAKMIAMDEDNYREAIEASFKVFAPHGISKRAFFKNI